MPRSLALRRPRLVLVLGALATSFFAAFAPGVRVDGSIENLLVRDDPARVFHRQIEDTFGSDEVIRIGLFAADVFRPEVLVRVAAITDSIEALPGVREVLSLSTLRGFAHTDEGLRGGRLLRDMPPSAEAARGFREKVLGTPVYRDIVASADGRATALNVILDSMSDAELEASGLEGEVRRRVLELRGGYETAITGIPVLKVQGSRILERDVRLFSVLGFAVAVGILFVFFRSPAIVTIAILPALAALAWTNGLLALLDRPITIGTVVLNPILLALGVAYSIHVVSRVAPRSVAAAEGAAEGRLENLDRSLGEIRTPVRIAAVTTALGFATLIPHPVPTIHELGVYAVFGVAVVTLMVLWVIPAAIAYFEPTPVLRDRRSRAESRIRGLARVSERTPWAVVAAGVAILLVCGWGARGIRVETDYLAFFDEGGEVRRDAARIATALAGVHPLHLIVTAEDSLFRADALAALDSLERDLEARPRVDVALTFLDHLREARRAVVPEQAGRLPTDPVEAEQLWLLVDPRDGRSVLRADGRQASFLLQTRLESSAAVREFIDDMDEVSGTLPAGLSLQVTGSVVLLNRTSDAIAEQQVAGLLQMLGVLWLVLSLLFRSFAVGTLSLVPNAFPIAVLFGVMGWTGVTLNVATSMIAVIALGIAVDDTVHYLAAVRAGATRGRRREDALNSAIDAVGRPIVITSLTLAGGFAVGLLSGFGPVREFAWLSALTMLMALVGDLVLTPAVARVFRFGPGSGQTPKP